MSRVVLIIAFIAAILGMVRYNKLAMPFKVIAIYLIYYFLDVVANYFVIEVLYKHNFVLLNTETLVGFLFFSITYYLLFRRGTIRKVILIVMIAYTILFLINSLTIQPYDQTFSSISMVISEVVFIFYALLLFKQMLLYPVQMKITRQSIFWFNLAVLFFSTLMFLNFALVNYYTHHNIDTTLLAYFWHLIDITLNVLLGIAILTDHKERSPINA